MSLDRFLISATAIYLFTTSAHVMNPFEFSLNVFTEFAEFTDKNRSHYNKGARTCHPATSCVRDQDATTSPVRHMWVTESLNWLQFILQWFIRFSEFTKCSAPFRKNSNVLQGTVYIEACNAAICVCTNLFETSKWEIHINVHILASSLLTHIFNWKVKIKYFNFQCYISCYYKTYNEMSNKTVIMCYLLNEFPFWSVNFCTEETDENYIQSC